MIRQMLKRSAVILAIVGMVLSGCSKDDNSTGSSGPKTVVLFEDDFEGPVWLDKWIIGGRQEAGTNTANCVTRNESTCGHLYKYSFTEINLSPDVAPFAFHDSLTFIFEMEVRARAWGYIPGVAYYGMAGVKFVFSSASAVLGSVYYLTASSSHPYDTRASDPANGAVAVTLGLNTTYSLTVADILANISIDTSLITSVTMTFNTYCSTYPEPYVEAELWIDNVSVVGLVKD